MDEMTTDQQATRYEYHPREVAARVTLPAAAHALVAPGDDAPTDGACVAITTACTALATRVGLMAHIGAPRADVVAGRVPAVTAFDGGELPGRILGHGAPPSRERIVLAGDRAVEAWRRWSRDRDAADHPEGVAGALALAAWCSWAVGAAARARTRASYALDVVPDDPVAALVERWCRGRVGPTWWSVASTPGDRGPTVG